MESIFQHITTNKEPIEQEIKTTEDTVLGSNIYSLFDGLVELFKQLELIDLDGTSPESKFQFIHAYPDKVKEEDVNTVTYHILWRRPRVTQGTVIQGSRSFTKAKPTFIGEQYNSITGNSEEFFRLEFDNVISLTVFSKKARVLNNLSRVMESIFLKYASYIKQYVDDFVYLGMSDIRFLPRYEEGDPFYSRELQFKVITTEVYKHELEQMKSLNIHLK